MQKLFSLKTLGVVAFIVILIAIPLTLQNAQKTQDIRQHADEGGKLICQPQGGMGNKYKSDTLVVTNNKDSQVQIWVQENECDYDSNNTPHEGYECNNFAERYPVTLDPGETKTMRRAVKNCKVVQIDANTDNGDTSGCFTPNGDQWDGGLAFTIKANDNCEQPTETPTPTERPTPTTPQQPTPTTPHEPTATPTTAVCQKPGAVQNVSISCPFCQ